ncbi:MAG: hypothetical protein JO353_10555, partial [Phycisphaerae bacterium]|nr:hypothetical protein [Phycisphaerae bacterium]
MADALINFMYVISRYFHLISMTLLVGGTLFYLWVVPTAIAELKEPHIVFARARWVFRRVVFASVLLLLVTGAIITAR